MNNYVRINHIIVKVETHESKKNTLAFYWKGIDRTIQQNYQQHFLNNIIYSSTHNIKR